MIRWLPNVLLGAVFLTSCSLFTLRDHPDAQTSTPAAERTQTSQSGQTASDTASSAQNTSGRTAASSAASRSDLEMRVDELNFQLKKQRAEVDYVKNQLDELQAKASIWLNPLSVYDKEIILNNGTSVFGKIVAQDERVIKVETLIGYLSLERSAVKRIVDNEATVFQEQETTSTKGGESPKPAPQPAAEKSESSTTKPLKSMTGSQEPAPQGLDQSANCVLVGSIKERTDASGNHIFSGTIKNTGQRRADFVKVHFQFRRNWSGDNKTMTAFVDGIQYEYQSGVESDAALPPEASGTFELYVPKSFGNYIGYSYSIDWEEYE
ncbi:MAG: hypothetical protein K9N46_01675 [Candidatus Marinimicrobia bacterium]|nr:hypothetical protein [Candidatus Neomarinimicrobiota bacterium]MCF7827813.1 hypothetical protein [Candidatus Neomarinimicrobiota bacterium]MCF7879432.1 hypothetical protein [Candidatus Neomarinimicrobiota bacterium]